MGLTDDKIIDYTVYWRGCEDESLLENAFREKINQDIDNLDDKTKSDILDSLKKIDISFNEKLTLGFEKTIESFRRKMLLELNKVKVEIIDDISKKAIPQIVNQLDISDIKYRLDLTIVRMEKEIKEINDFVDKQQELAQELALRLDIERRLDKIEAKLVAQLANFISDISHQRGKKIKKDFEIFSRDVIESFLKDENKAEEYRIITSDNFSSINYNPEMENDDYHQEKYIIACGEPQGSYLNLEYLYSLDVKSRKELLNFVSNLNGRKISYHGIAKLLNSDPKFMIKNYDKEWSPLDVIYFMVHRLKIENSK